MRLWIPPAAGALGGAIIAILAGVIAYRRVNPRPGWSWLGTGVNAGPAWTVSDSWVTNIAGVGAILGAVANALGGLGSVISDKDATGVIVLFIVFGGAAGIAPIVYAATAIQESQELVQMVGSIWGFLLAGVVSLLAVLGELATIGLLIFEVGNSGAVKGIVVAFISVAGLIVALYSVRALVLFATPAAGAAQRRSLLGSANNSATL